MVDRYLTKKALAQLSLEAYNIADDHGFNDDLYRLCKNAADDVDLKVIQRTFFLEQLAKVVGEVGEAVSAIQHDDQAGTTEEIADVFIRLFHICGLWDINIGCAILNKMDKNRARSHLHGKVC